MADFLPLQYYPEAETHVAEHPFTRRDRALMTLFIIASASLEIFFMIRSTAIAMH